MLVALLLLIVSCMSDAMHTCSYVMQVCVHCYGAHTGTCTVDFMYSEASLFTVLYLSVFDIHFLVYINITRSECCSVSMEK